MYSLTLLFIELLLQILVMYYIVYVKKESIENVLMIYAILKIVINFLLPKVFGYNIFTIRNDLIRLFNKNNKYLGLAFFGILIFIIMSIFIPYIIVDNYGIIALLAKVGIDSIFRPFYLM